ncbi:hypothetical protein CesoFtcFv8_006473 [Champsocephalus esox]|uniref:Uncharacterized protein n=1 Tax=Champsocephalus esox TaxID=159716 RepID=A0AAN8H9Z0_9TELE|nr:hypothetical protein CesoFtcFv8_006473 [Champsocephalus esox]
MCDLRLNVNPHGPEELEEGKGRVLAPQRLQYASDDNSAPNEEVKGFIGFSAVSSVSPDILASQRSSEPCPRRRTDL